MEPSDPKGFNNLYLVLEHAQSDLKKLLKSAIFLSELHIQTIIYNLLCGIKYMHSAKVIHRDIKPANILINEDCTIKICDFGLSRSIAGIEGSKIFIDLEYMKEIEEEEKKNKEEHIVEDTTPVSDLDPSPNSFKSLSYI